MENAATLATFKELKENIITESREDLLEIQKQAIKLQQPGYGAEKKELDQLRKTEISNSSTAICLSGGGIRSATFGLGVIQALAKYQLLDKFHYLSTVSGGGYIGSWLSAYIYQSRVKEALANTPDNQLPPKLEDDFISKQIGVVQTKLATPKPDSPEPPEVTHLRSYSNYMSPQLGLLSADTWTLVAVNLRNLLLNWMVIMPLLGAILLLPKLFISLLEARFLMDWEVQLLILVVAVWAGIVAISQINQLRPSLAKYSPFDQKFKEDDIGIQLSIEGKIFRWMVIWVLFLALGITVFWFWNRGREVHLPLAQTLDQFFGTNRVRLFDCILLALILFLSGYFLSWLIMLRKFVLITKKENLEQHEQAAREGNSTPFETLGEQFQQIFKTYFLEPIILVFCGILAGVLLYFVMVNLGDLATTVLPNSANSVQQNCIGNFSASVQINDLSTNCGINDFQATFTSTTNIPVDSSGFNLSQIRTNLYATFGVPIFLSIFLFAAAIFTGIAVKITNDDDREWMARFGAWLLIIIVGWAVLFATVIFGEMLFASSQNLIGNGWDSLIKKVGAVFAVVSGLFTVLSGFSSSTSASEDKQEKSWGGLLITSTCFRRRVISFCF